MSQSGLEREFCGVRKNGAVEVVQTGVLFGSSKEGLDCDNRRYCGWKRRGYGGGLRGVL